ncbi:MAG TPA: NUDIX hydrolase [Solirubrobacteraceae bacterium]|jgi:ADP-ribose pyrophosphatase|nr:NUDIX hydrolase [Solirubrobacteraceae bacterium]
MSIRRISGRTVYENRWMTVREDEIERADGTRGIYGVVEKPDFALIVPEEADGGLWLVGQFRYPVGAWFWEFPQGTWEQQDEVEPEALARGELREETGLEAGSLRRLGHLYQAYGFSNQGFDVWLATGLREGSVGAEREPEEQDMQVRRVTREQWEAMIGTGEVKDGPSIAAYGLLMLERGGA